MVATSIPDWAWVHEVQVEPHQGGTGRGATYGPPVDRECLVDATAKLVRRPDGTQIVASVQVFLPPGGDPIPPRSRVTLPAPWSRATVVVAVADRDGGGLPTPDHLHLFLE